VNRIAVIGVDVGGTWIRVKALSSDGKTVRSFKGHAPAVPEIPPYLTRLFNQWKVHPPFLAVGSRGVWIQRKRRALRRRLKLLADEVIVMSDVESAWLSAFKQVGILVISGTGSIAYARDSDGCTGRTGGLGPERGDHGSAYWIGKKWLQQNGRAAIPSVRRTAALAKTILRRARRGETKAGAVISEAQKHLAHLVADLAHRLHWEKRVPVSWTGSVLEDPWFRAGVVKTLPKLNKMKGLRAAWRPPKTDPATAIALYGTTRRQPRTDR